jgi:hypothetical protein
MSIESDGFDLSQMLQREDRAEAISWLRLGKGKHNIGEMSPQKSKKLVADLYKFGARQVDVVDIRANAGLASTDSLIVTLPREKKRRKRIFDWSDTQAIEMGLDPEPDRGQKYLFVWFD